MSATLRDRLAALRPDELRQLLAGLSGDELEAVTYDWSLWGRAEQQPPPGAWRVWLLLTGRGWGKTRTLSETVRQWANDPSARIALVGRTAGDVRDVLVEGPAGILSVFPARERPTYLPSVRRLIFKSGAIATTYSSEEPDLLRGPSHSHAAVDELAAWERAEEAWSNLQLTLRIGAHPRVVVATTPRPIKLLKELMASANTVVTRGRTADNERNLAPSALAEFYGRWGGTRLGAQELEGQLLEQVEGALWTRAILDETRVAKSPELARIVVGVDPAVSSGEGADETGIVVAGRAKDGHVYVVADRSLRASPDGWGRAVVAAFDGFKADRVIVEANQGGEMVETVLRTIRATLPVTRVHATRGKLTRAEPVAALFEQRKAHVVGTLPALEEQLATYAPGETDSPDRLDAMVWALSSLAGQRSGIEFLRAMTWRGEGRMR